MLTSFSGFIAVLGILVMIFFVVFTVMLLVSSHLDEKRARAENPKQFRGWNHKDS